MSNIEAFTFGSPEPVLGARGLFDYLECVPMADWYEPPVSTDGIARAYRSAIHHESALTVKRNILTSTFRPHPKLSRAEFMKAANNYLIFGNTYLQKISNRIGGLIRLEAPLAKYMRRGKDGNTYYLVQSYNDPFAFKPGEIFHLFEPDIHQDIYGVPQYLSAINSALLNESATLFRRKYYENGSHAGFILYMTDATQSSEDVEELRKNLKSAKGPGNFRNLFVYAPNGKKDGLQLIPVSEVAAKDEFLNIKNVTRDDILAAHRVPPQLMSILPNNTGGFGDAEKAAEIFRINEIEPLQNRFREINDWLGDEVVAFDEYNLK